jgi:L-lactate dehydrogenase complex protein LldG
MSSREAVLGRVRAALAQGEADAVRREAVRSRLAMAAPGPIPARARLEPAAQVELFSVMAEKANATVQRIAAISDIPEAVGNHLRRHNLPQRIRTGADALLAGLPWEREPHLERSIGASDGTDLVSVSRAFAGVAETATLVLRSGPDNPTTLNFLPDTHIVVLRAEDVVGDLETAFVRLRTSLGSAEAGASSGATFPRTINLITGPSRSADIEQTLILGAHGPRALHILLVG